MRLFTSSQAKISSRLPILEVTTSLTTPSTLNYLLPVTMKNSNVIRSYSGDSFPFPVEGEVLLYRFLLPIAEPPAHEDMILLSQKEQQRVLSYRLSSKGSRFAAGRAQLRRILASVLNCSPNDIEIFNEPSGRVLLVDKKYGLFFNLSYDGPWCVICLSKQKLIGVDIQLLSPRSRATFKQFFGTKLINTQLDETQIWVRMEALGKMTGKGLNAGLSYLFSIAIGERDMPFDCYFKDFKLTSEVLGTICVGVK